MQQRLSSLLQAGTTRISKGRHFELIAEKRLQAAGLQPLWRNYRCRGGEIDLIMRHDQTLVFVEVRHRADRGHGGAAASITRSKQQKVQLAARHYLQQHGLNEAQQACRFDVVVFEGELPEWIQNAF
ncbi:YraN family protein [Aeromonas sp. RU39B]|jgi:putative endonuclease|uniref:YraN family protein n=1 Tax=Aeromonas sp. RU39B TaxID=1907416 RepID=UPI0009706ED8|nr:YraN family protein [Aeromonas sp. RU39B]